jgi:hypothetical protein
MPMLSATNVAETLVLTTFESSTDSVLHSSILYEQFHFECPADCSCAAFGCCEETPLSFFCTTTQQDATGLIMGKGFGKSGDGE